MIFRVLACSFLLALTSPAVAKTFSNSYVSFDLPDDWKCSQEGPSWVCTPQLAKDARESLIVLNAKIAGPEDNFAAFKSYLSKPRTIAVKGSPPVTSQLMNLEELSIGGQPWIKAQHLSSEVPNFYTLYMVTTKSNLAILANFSTEKTKAQLYNPIFDRAVKSLRIVASQELLIPKEAAQEAIGIQVPAEVRPTPLPRSAPPKSQSRNEMLIILALLAIAGIGIYAWKRLS